jgi:hypothetical protein
MVDRELINNFTYKELEKELKSLLAKKKEITSELKKINKNDLMEYE